jgi:hypothetical protein
MDFLPTEEDLKIVKFEGFSKPIISSYIGVESVLSSDHIHGRKYHERFPKHISREKQLT